MLSKNGSKLTHIAITYEYRMQTIVIIGIVHQEKTTWEKTPIKVIFSVDRYICLLRKYICIYTCILLYDCGIQDIYREVYIF